MKDGGAGERRQAGMPASSPFESDVKRLFSAGTKEIEGLFNALKSKRDAFSTYDVGKGEFRDAPAILALKQVFVYLVEAAHGRDEDKRAQTMERVLSLGITKEKADHFFELAGGLDGETMDAVSDLPAATFYHAEISSGTRTRIDVNHVFLGPDMPKMVPTVSLQLTNIKENQTLLMRMDADESSVFARHVSGSLDRIKQETKSLKDSLGRRYVRCL